MFLAAWIYSTFLYLLITLFVIVSILLILIVLIQKGRGGGLASAFGGGGGNTAFGSKTGDVLTWATSIIFGIFLLVAITLNLMTRPGTVKRVTAAGTPAQQTAPDPAPSPAPAPVAPTTQGK